VSEEHKQKPGWERETLEKLAMSSLRESRRARRWGIFFKLLGFAYLFILLGLMLGDKDVLDEGAGKHTAVVNMRGIIADQMPASADFVVSGLRKAFKDKNTAGVILRINSPGGSPVQSGYINDEIKRLRGKYPDIPFYAVITDIGASGAYYVAVAADRIYADKASIIGSIGVRMDGFGFVDAIDKLGIERRLRTAGESKGMLDPFLPEDPQELEHIETMLGQIHTQFIDTVKAGRGDKLSDENMLFSGLIWTGEEAMELGLIDGLGSASYVAREVIKEEKIVDFTQEENVWKRLTDRLGASIANTLLSVVRTDTMQLQ
jgi:protease-4